MITNDKQHRVATEKLTMLKESFAREYRRDVPDVVRRARKGQLESLVSEVEAEVKEYEKLKSTKPESLTINSANDLMLMPIRYRIASNMSVESFSRMVKVSTEQVLHYEASRYSDSSTKILMEILSQIGVSIRGRITL